MLSANQINKSFGLQPVLKNVSFSINPGDRLGLIGPNGCGKTTLLRIINGLEKADSGTVITHPSDLKVGYLPQGFEDFNDLTVGQYLDSLLPGGDPSLDQLEELAQQLGLDSQNPELQERYDRVLQSLAESDEARSRMESVINALGLEKVPRDLPAIRLSGGQKTRLALADVLIKNPVLMLLDEPTNHLDITMRRWLEEWLINQPGAVLMVSHDRVFLNKTTNGILYLDPHGHTMKYYAGNYDAYWLEKQKEEEKAFQQYQDQQVEIRHARRSVEKIRALTTSKTGSKTQDNDKFAKGFFSDRRLEVMRRAKAVEKRVDRLLNEDHIEKPSQLRQIKMELEGSVEGARDVLVLKDLSVGFESAVLITGLDATIRFGSRVVLTGENGCGKTSLLRTLMGEVQPLSGEFRFGSRIKPGYMAQDREENWFNKDPFTSLSQNTNLNETEVRRFLSFYLFFGDEVFKPLEKLSYGERSRLSLACLVAGGCNFLLLDEPTNHLDIPSSEQFEKALEGFNGTALIVSHDRFFNHRFATHIWEITDNGIRFTK